jgi:hypothetical protein
LKFSTILLSSSTNSTAGAVGIPFLSRHATITFWRAISCSP